MRLFDVVLVLVLLGCSAVPEEELPAEHAAEGGGTSSGVGGGSGAGGTFGGSMSDAGRAGLTSSAGSSVGGRSAAGTAGNTAFDGAMSGPTTHPWDWAGIVGTGQSLSVGAEAYNIVLDTQPFKNLKLALNGANVTLPPYDANDAALSVVPLVEPIRGKVFGFPEPYPTNIYGETPHTAMADQISSLFLKDTGEDYITVHSAVGESGMAIDVIGKNATPDAGRGHAYAASLFEVTALKRLAAAAGKTYGVGGIILTHGETDWGNPDYESKVYQLYTDYNADLRAITGQTQKVPLFLSQQQTCPGDNSSAASLIAQWKSGVDHPGEVICVGPKYQYPYANDHVHLLPAGYDMLGEKYAEVYYEKVVLGHDWQPLQPISATLAGAAITVKFHVPVPPLAWDSTLPPTHQSAHTAWSSGKGFEVANSAGEQAISSVAIQNDAVVITLASAPATTTGLVVRYAITTDPSGNPNGTLGGKTAPRNGQLRDSDPIVGYATKLPQYNFAVSFVLPVARP